MPPRRRSPLRSIVLAASVALPLLAATDAGAEESSTDTVVGELVQAWSEARRGDAAPAAETDTTLLSWVRPARGDAVRVPTEDLPEVPGLAAGATVEITVGGDVADDAAAEEGLDPARDLVDLDLLAAAPPLSPAGPGTTNEVTVVMVRPGGTAPPPDAPTTADVVGAVSGPVKTFWSTQSAGRIELEVTAQHDWISTTATCATPELLFQEAADAVHWTGGPAQHLLLYVPPTDPDCAYGLGSVGTGVADGGVLYVTDTLTSVIAHEIGHNLSLGHASALQCDGTVDAGECGLFEYWDLYDVMGFSWEQLGSLGGPHAARLGLIPGERVRTVRTAGAGGVYPLAPVGSPSGLRAVRILGADGSVYWIEYRAPVGQDSWLGTPDDTVGLETGVVLRLAAEGDDTSLLLDATPSPEADWATDFEQALTAPGQDAVLADGDLVVRLEALTATSAQVRVLTPIEARYDDPAVRAVLGAPTATPQVCGLPDGGCSKAYATGTTYWSPVTGARYVRAPLDARYRATGPAGPLGYPTGDSDCPTGDTRCTQRFQGGWVTSTSAQNVRAVWGAMGRAWTAGGGPTGPRGLPVSDERCGLRDGGCYQRFELAVEYWTHASGAHFVDQSVVPTYRAAGYEVGPLGYPVTEWRCALPGGGCVQRFQGGWIYRSDVGWDSAVYGAIGRRYAAEGYERGRLGYPEAGESCIPGVCAQAFAGGTVAYSRAAGTKIVRGAIRGAWWPDRLGNSYPVSEERCGLVRSGCFQLFRTGSIYWSPTTGARRVGVESPELLQAWAAQGYERGRLGYPTSPELFDTTTGAVTQRFEGGTLRFDPDTGRVRRV